MAKIKFSALVQEMRNKLNGSVLSKNRYGNYVRNKTTPVNPRTAAQQAVRARLSTVSTAWRGLTSAAREGFTALAASHPFTDIFGDQKILDGKAMFSKLNMNLLNAGKSMLSAAQPFVAIPYLEINSATVEDDGTVSLAVSEATVPVGHTLIVAATPMLSPTINFVKNQFRDLGTFSAVAGVVDLGSAYAAKFGAPTPADVGKRIAFRAFLVNDTTGQTSIASQAWGVVNPNE